MVELSEQELEFMDHYCDPTSLTENLIPENHNAPQKWNEDADCIYLRDYQMPMQNFSYMYADDPELTKAENYKKKIGAGTLYSIGSRNTGKSFLTIIDVFLTAIHKTVDGCIASFDDYHLKKVTEPIASFCESHPFFKIFHLVESRKSTVKRDRLTISTEHGTLITAANEKSEEENPGIQYQGKHSENFWGEESSYLTRKGELQRIDAKATWGCIERFSGIADLIPESPLTRILKDPKKKNWTWRLPQMVRGDWTEELREEKIEEYQGEDTPSYRLNVLAEIIEGAFGFFDMKRVKDNCLNKNKRIKYFEVNRSNFNRFKENLIIERLPGAEQVFVSSDIGRSASPSEVMIWFYDGKKYKYEYQISLFKLTIDEQAEVFYWLYKKLGSAFINLDASDGTGEGIVDKLFDMGIPQKHLLKVKFNKNIEVDFEKDEEGNIQIDGNGDPITKKVNTVNFAMQRIEHLFYNSLLELPIDEKLFKQITGVIAKQFGTTVRFAYKTENHIFQSIPKDEIIFCKIDNKLVSDTIENIENLTSKVSVPTYDKGKLVWKVGKIVKEKNKGNKILDFKFRPAKSLKVTEGHSMMKWDSKQMELVEVLARDVKVGDLMLCAKNLNAKLSEEYLTDNVFYRVGRRKIKFQREIVINEDFAYLLGWCCAEGSRGGDWCYTLSLNVDDPIEKIAGLIDKIFGFRPRIYKKPPIASIVFLGGRKITDFIVKHIGSGAKTKKFPTIILNSKASVQQAFLDGLIEGDGNKDKRLTTTSRNVANGFFTSNSLREKHTAMSVVTNRYNNKEYYINDGIRDGYYENIPFKALPYDYKSNDKTITRKKIKDANYTWKIKSRRNKEILNKVKDFEFIEVKSIKSYDYDDNVYDISVKGTHNFLAGVGNVVVHNSLQCLSICQYFNKDNPLKNVKRVKRCYGLFFND